MRLIKAHQTKVGSAVHSYCRLSRNTDEGLESAAGSEGGDTICCVGVSATMASNGTRDERHVTWGPTRAPALRMTMRLAQPVWSSLSLRITFAALGASSDAARSGLVNLQIDRVSKLP